MKNVPHLLEGDNIAIDRAGMEKNGKCAEEMNMDDIKKCLLVQKRT